MSVSTGIIEVSTLIWALICLIVMGAVPLILALVISVKNRGTKGFFFCLLAGLASFFIMQIVIRLPILSLLGSLGVTPSLAAQLPWLYLLILALSASLFEGAGRILSIKILMKNRLWANGALAHGIGHGGVECLYIGALTQLNNVIFILLINTGQIDTLSLPEGTADLVVSQLNAARPYEFALSLTERLVVLCLQIALSVFAVYAIRYHKLGWLGAMFGIHFLVDFIAPAISAFSPYDKAATLLWSECVVALFALLGAVLAFQLYRKMRRDDRLESAPADAGRAGASPAQINHG